jgi:hypothetical protein
MTGRALVVDDDSRANRMFLRRALTELGIESVERGQP